MSIINEDVDIKQMNEEGLKAGLMVNKACEQLTSTEQLLRDKIKLFKANGLPTDQEEAKLAELEERYPFVLNLPDLEWLIDGVLPRGGIAGIGGLTDAGKTTFTLQLTHSLLSGDPFLDIPVKHKVEHIAYACLDQSSKMLKDQVKKMLPVYASLKQLRVVKDLVWDRRVPEIAGLKEVIRDLAPQVIVIDALSSVVGETDENAAMGPPIRELRRMTERYGVSFIILHQFRKPLFEARHQAPTAQDFRGSTEIGAKAEVLLALQRNHWEVKVTSVKAKSNRKLELDLLQDPETLTYKVSATKRERITNLLNLKKPVMAIVDEIQKEYGGNKESIRRLVYRIMDEIKQEKV
jgi:predicted ATP-dependent serine protease